MDIQKIRKQLGEVYEKIRKKEVDPCIKGLQFKSDYKEKKPERKTFKISTIEDLGDIPNMPGFYVIFSDIESKENTCKAHFADNEEVKAIYRGEASKVRNRIKSHLFNSEYVKEAMDNKIGYFETTLKIKDNKVNIDVDFKQNDWYVFYFAAPKSTSEIRRLMEKSFDEIFKKPPYSNEKN